MNKFFAVLLALLPMQAMAGDAILATAFGNNTGVFYGDILPGDAQKLDDFLTDNPQVTDLYLSSPGGSASEGYDLSRVISNHGVSTRVAWGDACISACATAFLGGTNYYIGGQLAFHVSYIPEEVQGDMTVNDALIAGQGSGARAMMHTISNGFTPYLTMVITHYSSPTDFIVFRNTPEFMQFFARTEEENLADYMADPFAGIGVREWVDRHQATSGEIFAYFLEQRSD